MEQNHWSDDSRPAKGRTRRDFLAAGGLGAAAFLALGANLHAADGDVSPEVADLEKKNLQLVNDFCAAWATRDADKLGEFFADDAVFRMNDNAKPAEGKATIVLRLKAFLGIQKKAEFVVNRAVAMGNVVLNDRYDRFESGLKNQEFHMTGVFLLKEGKIKEWHDFSWPRSAKEGEAAPASQ